MSTPLPPELLAEEAFQSYATGNFQRAESLCRQVLAAGLTNPSTLAKIHLTLGSICLERGQFEEAVRDYSASIELAPSSAAGHFNLGLALLNLRRLEEAAAAFEQAVRYRSDYAKAFALLAEVRDAQGRHADALPFYRRSLEIDPGQDRTSFYFGSSLLKQRQYAQAVAAFETVTRLSAHRAEGHQALAVSRRESGDLQGAMKAALAAAKLAPNNMLPFVTIGDLFHRMGRPKEACAALRKAVALNPESEDLKFALAAISGEGGYTSIPTTNILKLFENYAPTFESHLVNKLQYRGPQQLMEAIIAVAPNRKFDMFDLGCGTGLCAAEFRPIANYIRGVDIAPAMVDRAKARGVYDEVSVSEIVPALQRDAERYDLITAADVFEYIGDLNDVFAAAFTALRVGGLFAFSVERSNSSGLVLQTTLRFAHSLEYIRQVTARHHFIERYVQERPLRLEDRSPLAAWIMALEKPA